MNTVYVVELLERGVRVALEVYRYQVGEPYLKRLVDHVGESHVMPAPHPQAYAGADEKSGRSGVVWVLLLANPKV